MGLTTELNHTTVLTPTERERKKSPQQRAEDVIYTLNHTFTCLTLTDLFVVPILRGFGLNIGHGHKESDHSGGDDQNYVTRYAHIHDDNCGHGAAASKRGKSGFQKAAELAAEPKAKPGVWKRIGGEIKGAFSHFDWKDSGAWFGGEIIGDVGAAFVTIPVQRFFPGFMQGIRHAVEPVVGGFFHRGSERAAHKWADKRGLTYDAQEVVDRAERLYQYEMQHLPQMAVWTVSSIGLHYGAMKLLLKKDIGLGEFARDKAAGAGITAGLVFGARAVAPDRAHRWDETLGKHAVVPLTKTVGKLFGVKERDVDDFHARQAENDNDDAPQSWAKRVKAEPVPTLETVRQH